MTSEREWVEEVKLSLQAALAREGLTVVTGLRLPYSLYVAAYRSKPGALASTDPATESHGYQTDLLIAEQQQAAAQWVPRVVVEFKLGSATTHDALTYSAKAATHKSVHPYLRYGIVIGGLDGQVPRRLMRHGHNFDFMATLPSEKLGRRDRDQLAALLMDEVRASQTLSRLLAEKSDIKLLHRKLEVR